MSSLLSDDTRYVKLVLLVVKGGTYVLGKHTHKILTPNNTSIDVFLSSHRDKIQNDLKKKHINREQWKKLCPDSGETVDVNCWDISLHAYVLLNLTDGELQGNEKNAIGSLRDKRNYLAHSTASSLSEKKFLGEWSHLTIILLQLTMGLTSEEQLYINNLITDIFTIQDFHKATTELKAFEKSEDFVKDVIAVNLRSEDIRLDDLLQRVEKLEKSQCRIERQLEITARVTVNASTRTARDAAHHQLLEAAKSCVPRGHDKQDNDEVFTACNNLFTAMSKGDVSLRQVDEGSVLITFRCLTWTGLKNAILYLTKPLYVQRFGELENVLSRSVNSCVKLNVNIVLETLISTLDSAEQCTNEKSVLLTLNCKGSKGVRNAVSYLVNGSSTNTVNNMSEALSRSVGERIELHTSIDVDKLEKEIIKLKHLYGYQDDVRSRALPSFAMESIVKINSMTICLVEGDIKQQKVDVIVNTTDKFLDLKVGSVSGPILEFGQQSEANFKYSRGVTDDIAQTEGHRLNCQIVLHIALTKWIESQNSNDENMLALCDKVCKCIDIAERDGFSSIAFPAVGCGHFGYPSDLVARLMLTSFHEHAKDGSVKHIRIVIHELDKETFREFEKTFESWSYGGAKAKSKLMTEKKNHDKTASRQEQTRQPVIGETVKIGNTKVMVVAEDIAIQPVNVVVNISKTEDQLYKGFVSRSLLNAAGIEIANGLTGTYPNGMKYGDIVVMFIRRLTYDLLLHGCLAKWQGDNTKASSESLHNLDHHCIAIAEEDNWSVNGTGFLGYPRLMTSRDMFQTINNYKTTNGKKVITVVYPQDLNSVKDFQTEFEKWYSDWSVKEKFPPATRQTFGYIGQIHTCVISGSVVSEKVDMIARIIATNLKLVTGGSVEELGITNEYGLKCTSMVYGLLPRWHLNTTRENVKGLKNFMLNCLQVAEAHKCKSIVFSTNGLGYMGYPVKIVAREMMKAVKTSPLKHVKEVKFVVNPKANRALQVFEEELAKALKDDHEILKSWLRYKAMRREQTHSERWLSFKAMRREQTHSERWLIFEAMRREQTHSERWLSFKAWLEKEHENLERWFRFKAWEEQEHGNLERWLKFKAIEEEDEYNIIGGSFYSLNAMRRELKHSGKRLRFKAMVREYKHSGRRLSFEEWKEEHENLEMWLRIKAMRREHKHSGSWFSFKEWEEEHGNLESWLSFKEWEEEHGNLESSLSFKEWEEEHGNLESSLSYKEWEKEYANLESWFRFKALRREHKHSGRRLSFKVFKDLEGKLIDPEVKHQTTLTYKTPEKIRQEKFKMDKYFQLPVPPVYVSTTSTRDEDKDVIDNK